MQEYEKEVGMQYVTSAERIGLQKGMAQGMKLGEKKLLRVLLESKFGRIPTQYLKKLEGYTEVEIEQICKAILTVKKIDDLFK